MNTIKSCFPGMGCLAQGIYNLFNRITQCCRGKPRVKKSISKAIDTLSLIPDNKRLGDRKVIYLIPDNHYSKEDRKFVRTIRDLSAEKLVYAIESIVRDDSFETEFKNLEGLKATDRIYGVEDPFCILFCYALNLNKNLKDERQKTLLQFQSEIKIHILSTLVSKANQRYLSKFWESETLQNNCIFEYFESDREDLISKGVQELNEISNNMIKASNITDWIELTEGLVRILAPDLRKKLEKIKYETEIFEDLLKSLSTVETNYNATEDLEFLKALHLSFRNDIIAQNLVNIFDITEDLQKPLVSILGAKHVPGIRQLLDNKGFTVLGKSELIEELKK